MPQTGFDYQPLSNDSSAMFVDHEFDEQGTSHFLFDQEDKCHT